MSRLVFLHGVSKKIVSDTGTQFTSKFWERLYESLDTQLRFYSAYHPQTDGQTERVNQILEDMLRACVLQYGRSWHKSPTYAEFSYNNSYQESLKMAPYIFHAIPRRASVGGPHTIPYTFARHGRVSYNSVTVEATSFVVPHKSRMRQYKIKLAHGGQTIGP
jgi:transposase InsO family protein